MTHEDIAKRLSALYSEMLERRKKLNEEFFYPVEKQIQEDCGKLGHVKGRYVDGVVVGYFKCGYCGAVMNETKEPAYVREDSDT